MRWHEMLDLLVGAFAVFSAVLGWRLVTVVTTSTDRQHRADAIRMFGYIWGGSTLGTGVVAGLMRMYQLGMFT